MLKIADTSQIGTASTFWLPEYFSGRASGTLIGRYTAVVAAHSFYSRNDHDWYPLANWAVDVVKRRNDNTLLEERTAVYPPTYFCYALTIPSGYMMYGGTEWDFGVFEATCDTNPGSYTGWLPAGVGSDYDLVSSSSYIEGYDAAVDIKGNPLPPQNVGSYHYFYGSLLTRFAGPSAAWPDPYYSYVIDTVMDVSPGASGSGIVKNLFLANYGDPTYYWSGVVRREGLGDPADGDYQYNIVRRHDWPMWWFISGATTEW